MKKLLGTKEASEALGISQERVRELLRQKKIKAVKIGRLWKIDMEDIEKIMKGENNWLENVN